MNPGDTVGTANELEGAFHPEPHDEHLAVGVILRRDNKDAVTRVALRATTHDRVVFFTYRSDPDRTFLDTLQRFNVRIVPPSSRSDDLALLSTLLETAHEEGYSSLVFHKNPREYIDYERTAVRVAESQSSLIRPVTTRYAPSKRNSNHIVGIPAYNEGETVGDVVTGALQYADTVLVVDDGSEDDTPKRASDAGATVICHETNRGYGAALKTLFREAQQREAEWLVVLDGDSQHDPDDIPQIVDFLRSHDADLVIGNRFAENVRTDMPKYRRVGLGVVNGLTNLSLGILHRENWISDTQNGFRVYSERAIRTLARDESINDGMAASTDILDHVMRHDYRIAEAGIEVDYDVENGSTHEPISHGLGLVSNILKNIASYRPVTFIGVTGVGMMLFGLAVIYWITSPLLSAGTVVIAPTFVAAVSLLVGTVACVTSLILRSLHITNGHYDEASEMTDG